MTVQPFLIANTKIGTERDLEPWLLPNDGFPDLQDCYIFRGRVKKRMGYNELGRLQRLLPTQNAPTTTNGAGNLTITIPGFSLSRPMPQGGSSFIVGTTVYQDAGGTGADPQTLLISTGGSGTATLDRGTGGNPGQLIISGGPINTQVTYVAGLPVMALPTQESTTINIEGLLAFDTTFAYIFSNSAGVFQDASFYKGTTTVLTWSGTNSQKFWSTNYATALWATNNVPGYQSMPTSTTGAGDGIRWFDQDGTGWVNFLPPIDGQSPATAVMTALMIFPYKGRLVFLNTQEGRSTGAQKSFPQRARWSQNGTPFYVAPTPTNYQGGVVPNAWRSDIVGFGGFIDAPTLEEIVSAQFVKDTLIVYFERSTWQLRYTGQELLPFIWEKINTELGSGSTFSVVPFDKVTMAIGNVGIHACDSVNVQRIDQKIPNEVFNIQNLNQGIERISGIRDFFNQLIYWSVPYRGYDSELGVDTGEVVTFPNKLIVYNYVEQSFSFFNDSFTSFGYFQPAQDLTWGNATMEWQAANFPWISPGESGDFPDVVGGNQQGFVEILMQKVANDDSLFISNITVSGNTITIFSPNHNLETGDFVKITSAGGLTGNTLIGNIYEVTVPLIGSPLAPDPNNFTIQQPGVTGVYTGPGTITIVNNISILSKRFNPFIEEGIQVRLHRVDFYFDTTADGQVTVNIFNDEDSTVPINTQYNVINTFPETTYSQDDDTVPFANAKLWKRQYFRDISQLFQIEITLSNAQMVMDNIVESDIVLHGIVLYFSKAGRLINV